MPSTSSSGRAWARSAAVFVACTLPVLAGAQTTVDPQLSVETVLTGLSRPTTMAFVAAGDFLFLEKDTGRVRRVLNGVLQPGFALEVSVDPTSERGMLGIAVNSEEPPGVFLFFTESSGGSPVANRVVRYDWSSGTGTLVNPTPVLDLPVLPGPNHDGGVLALGPPGEAPGVGDGALLYALIGDLNRSSQLENFPAGDPPGDTSVVLRVRQDGVPAPGNPFDPYCSVTTATPCDEDLDCPGGETCITEVARYWAYGVRNGFGLALDPETGLLWDTENGPGSMDEVNALPAGTNSGWARIMGPDTRDPQGIGDLFDIPGAGSTYSDPEFSWAATIAPTGILFPSGGGLGAAYDDVVLVGDFNLGQIYAFPLNGARDALDLTGFSGVADRVSDSAAERDQFLFGSGFGGSFSGVSDLELGPDGTLYVVSIGRSSQATGAIYAIRGAPAEVPALSGAWRFALACTLVASFVAARHRVHRPPASGKTSARGRPRSP